MLNSALCAVCWFVSSVMALPLVLVSWSETGNTCSSPHPMLFIATIGNLCWAYAFGRQLYVARPISKMAGFWTGSAIYQFLPFLLILLLGGPKSLLSVYDGFTRHFTRDLWQSPLELGLKMCVFLWMPIAGVLSLSFALYAAIERTMGFPALFDSTRDHWKYHWVVPAVLVVAGTLMARQEIWWSDFETLEHRVGQTIARSMHVHSMLCTNIPITNLTELGAVYNRDPLKYSEEQLARYGRHAGFERSIHEKYTFISPPVTNRKGHIVLVSSRPSPRKRGASERMLIFWQGPGGDGYYAETMEERHVQRIFDLAERRLTTRPAPAVSRMKGVPIHIRLADMVGVAPQWASEFCLLLFTGAILSVSWRLRRRRECNF